MYIASDIIFLFGVTLERSFLCVIIQFDIYGAQPIFTNKSTCITFI